MKFYLALLLFFASTFTVFGQNGTVRGTVFDGETGESVIGANVVLKSDNSIGASTDLDGQFTLSLPPGDHSIIISYITYKSLEVSEIKVVAGQVVNLNDLQLLPEAAAVLGEVVVTAEATATTEAALAVMKKKASVMIDGISASKMKLTGDATAVEAAKRVTGVSIEGGKYVYVRGLGDRYTKTTLNGVDIPGLDPDKNSLQMDIFPTNLIKSIVVSKNFTADAPADFTGGLLNVETKDFPEDKIFNVSISTTYNPSMHLNPDYLTYKGGGTDFLGFDDGTRALPQGATATRIPTPISGASTAEVTDFINSFSPELAATRQTSPLDYSVGISFGNQIQLKERKDEVPKLGYIFSLSYKNSFKYYDQALYGEYQRRQDPALYELRYATTQDGEIGEHNVLLGTLAGIAYKTSASKVRLTVMHLQNGESRAGKFFIDNSVDAVGQSGYFALSENLEYNQRSLTNVFLGGTHLFKENKWELVWKASPTLSISNDPDIRKTAFTQNSQNEGYVFSAGAGGFPSRIWRNLTELNAVSRLDLTNKHSIGGRDAKLKFGVSHVYKSRNYEILFYNMRFFGSQTTWEQADANAVLQPENIYPSDQNNIYYQSGNPNPNPNEYSSSSNNTALYISEEFAPTENLKAILGVRMENFVQQHTGRDQAWASGNTVTGKNLDNEQVLASLNFFPSANFIYALSETQNLRAAYSRTIARPSFKELSFAQILDPVSNRIFNGSLFEYSDWNGELVETNINNIDLRWELFLESGQLFSVSAFYKGFQNPIELVRIAEQQTSTEFQPRNVGQGTLYGLEFEINKNLGFVGLEELSLNGNLTLVQSSIDMTDNEFNSRKSFERQGETIENTRPMAGQAPYVVNLGAVYGSLTKGLDVGLFYNVKGPTLHIVGLGLFPDVYYQPFHSLNFSVNKKLGATHATSIDFKVSNLLNDKIEYTYQSYKATNQIFGSLNPGMSFGVGVSHEF